MREADYGTFGSSRGLPSVGSRVRSLTEIEEDAAQMRAVSVTRAPVSAGRGSNIVDLDARRTLADRRFKSERHLALQDRPFEGVRSEDAFEAFTEGEVAGFVAIFAIAAVAAVTIFCLIVRRIL